MNRKHSIKSILIIFAIIVSFISSSIADVSALQSNTKKTSSSITVEQAIVLIMSGLGKKPDNKPLDSYSGQKPSSSAKGYISAAISNKFLPTTLTKLSSPASKSFSTSFFLMCCGFKVWQDNLTSDQKSAIDAAILNVAFKSSVISSQKTNLLASNITKTDISNLLSVYKLKSLGWYTRTAAWQFYSKNNIEAAAIIFKICADAGLNSGSNSGDIANACYGYGVTMSHNSIKNFYSATIYLKKAIELDPKGIGKNAETQLKKLPPVQVGFDYMPEKPITYEELLSSYVYNLYYDTSNIPANFAVKDKNGNLSSAWSRKFVNCIYYKKLFPSIPNSFSDSVPRYWAASFAARVKFYLNYDYDKYYPFDDLNKISADDKMFINIALDRNLFPMPKKQNIFDPNGTILRKDLKSLINCSNTPGEPHKAEYTKKSYTKVVDAYYSHAGKGDSLEFQNDKINEHSKDLNILSFDMLKFSDTKYQDSEDTKYLTINDNKDIILEAISIAHQKNLKIFVDFPSNVSDSSKCMSMIQNKDSRTDLINDLLYLSQSYNLDGVQIGFEHLKKENRTILATFAEELSSKLKSNGKLLSSLVGAYSSDLYESASEYDLEKLGTVCDYIKLILYDNYTDSNYKTTGLDGPISEIDWNERILKYSVLKIPSRKILLGIGAYATLYNFTKKEARDIPFQNIDLELKNAASGTIKRLYNDKFQAPYIEYKDKSGNNYRIWYEDKRSLLSRMNQVHKYDLGGIFYYWLQSDNSDLFYSIENDLR